MEIAEAEARLLELAAEVAECTDDDDVVGRLLTLQDILDQCPLGGPALSAVRRQAVECGLVRACIDALAQELAAAEAGRFALLMANCLVGLRMSPDGSSLSHERDKELEMILLPAACRSLLVCGARVQKMYRAAGALRQRRKDRSNVANDVAQARRSLLTALVNITDALVALCSWRPSVTSVVLRSPDVIVLASATSASADAVILGALLHVVRIAGGVPGSFGDKHALLSFLDALFQRFSSSLVQIHSAGHAMKRSHTQLRVAQLASQVILRFVDGGAVEADTLGNRYHDTVPLTDLGDHSDSVYRLLMLLRRASAAHKHQQERIQAVVCIQRRWRGYRERCQWMKVLTAVFTVQHWWRRRWQRRQAEKSRDLLQRQKLFAEETRRHQQLVEKKKQESKLLHCIPAQDVNRFLTERAAVVLQAHWRGWLARRHTTNIREASDFRRKNIAASRIQRAFRKYTHRKVSWTQGSSSVVSSNLLEGIGDQRRGELQRLVTQWRQQNPYSFQSLANLQELHDRVHISWVSYCSRANERKQKSEQLDSLLARLHTDLSDLQTMPSLNDIQPTDVDRFASHSSTVATIAMEKHQQKLASLNSKWWEMPVDCETDWTLPEEIEIL